MRTLRLATTLAVVAALSACGNPLQPAMERHATPGATRLYIGTYVGSGLSAGDSTFTASPDTDSVSRGPGYGGSGH